MKVCSFNVNSIRFRKDLIVEWLDHREKDVDVLCFQELKTTEENFPFEDFEKLGYFCGVFGQKAYNGVAICSRLPVEVTRKGFGDAQWDEQRRIISTKIKNIDINILNIYAPHGGLKGEEKYHYKRQWYKQLISFLEASFSPKDPLLIVGDLNVAREDQDVFDPKSLEGTIGTMPEERKAFQNLLDWGLTDVFRHLYPDRSQFTWWNYIGGAIWKNEGMRIDYVLCTKPLIPLIKDVEVDLWPRRRRTPKPSDHAPVIATLDDPGK
jgi:exodeoxyribonuclease-3